MLLNRLKKAFTILELLVVIIIIGVVSIVAIPNVREFLAERNPEKYKNTNDDYDINAISELIKKIISQ